MYYYNAYENTYKERRTKALRLTRQQIHHRLSIAGPQMCLNGVALEVESLKERQLLQAAAFFEVRQFVVVQLQPTAAATNTVITVILATAAHTETRKKATRRGLRLTHNQATHWALKTRP